MSTDPKRPQIIRNGNIEFIVEETIEGDSLEERFEHLYDNGGFEEADLFHVYRKRINDFYDHLYAKKPKRFQDKSYALVPWRMIGVLLDMDYRTLRDFALYAKTPHKATWKKLKPLLDLLEEKEKE